MSLCELRIGCSDGLEDFLSLLIVPGFPNLSTLSLVSCKLKSQHLTSLAQAKVKGRTTGLEKSGNI